MCTGQPRSATSACAPASCIVACRTWVASWTLPFPPLQPALLTHPIDPHSHGHVINVFGILKGEYNTIQGIIQWPMAYDSKPYAGSAEQCNNHGSDSPMYVSYTDITCAFADVCSPTHGPCVALVGPWTVPSWPSSPPSMGALSRSSAHPEVSTM